MRVSLQGGKTSSGPNVCCITYNISARSRWERGSHVLCTSEALVNTTPQAVNCVKALLVQCPKRLNLGNLGNLNVAGEE